MMKTDFKSIQTSKDYLEKRKESIKSGVYAHDYVVKKLKPEVLRYERQIKEKQDALKRKIRECCDEYKAELRAAEALNPSQLNDDIRLLQAGVILDASDLQDIIKRNADNPTMSRLLIQYANQNQIDIGDYTYIGNQPMIDSIDALEKTTETVMKWFDRPHVFDQLLGEGSDLAMAFGSDEDGNAGTD